MGVAIPATGKAEQNRPSKSRQQRDERIYHRYLHVPPCHRPEQNPQLINYHCYRAHDGVKHPKAPWTDTFYVLGSIYGPRPLPRMGACRLGSWAVGRGDMSTCLRRVNRRSVSTSGRVKRFAMAMSRDCINNDRMLFPLLLIATEKFGSWIKVSTLDAAPKSEELSPADRR